MNTGFISFIGWLLINGISKTLRIRQVNADSRGNQGGKNVIFAFWHGEQFIPCFHHRHQNVVIMSSLSRDGEIQTGIMSRFGYKVVRGSSTRGGERALVETIRLVRNGYSAAFAVDGPRGPYHEVKPGIVYLAQKTGKVIIPVSSAAKRFKVFSRAWDQYQLPVPFGDVVVAYGEPIEVKEGDDPEEKRRQLQQSLEELSRFTHSSFWSEDVKEYLRNHPRPQILIVQPSRIGDVLFSLPTLSSLRKTFPKAWIGWMVDERCAPIIEGHPALDEVIIFDRRKISPVYLKKVAAYLHNKKIDISIDLHGLFKSAFMVLLSGAKFRLASASTRGMKELSWLVSKEIRPVKEQSHCVERHLAVAAYLGGGAGTAEYGLEPGETEQERIRAIIKEKNLSASHPIIVMHPGGGWISRRWFPERFAALATKLVREMKAQVVLVGGKEGGAGEKGLNEQIIAQARCPIVDLTGQLSLKELSAMIASARVFVGNEAGPLHLAVALQVPSVAILGPTDPQRTGPFGGKTKIVRHIVECQPCRERRCASRECMEGISVDEVFGAVRKMIHEEKQSAHH